MPYRRFHRPKVLGEKPCSRATSDTLAPRTTARWNDATSAAVNCFLVIGEPSVPAVAGGPQLAATLYGEVGDHDSDDARGFQMKLPDRETSVIYALPVAVALALGLVACAASTPRTTVDAPASPGAASTENPAAVLAVQAYLRTFKLNEKDLAEGLTIPFGYGRDDGDSSVGVAKVMGRTGRQGHQVYQVVLAQCLGCRSRYMEIAPNPAPAAATQSSSATPPSPAPTVR